ncbi:MAG: 16S rRNA (adenine(1518)-N(6)/adenine(1519)-N(6))-dimethyltransferase RsmA [Spirochaetaceae bacterium]|nr:16S rRNA (adenine(1518)-N(6)/adenine(1519)-N(6))-dimethyltransferase RsmA [Spirochaetaceae bacterium]
MRPLSDEFYNSPAQINALLAERNLAVQKKFGQNFLIHPELRKKLVLALDAEPGSAVWEVGPGLGAETRLLLEGGASVTAFEVDRGYCLLLNEMFAAGYPQKWKLVEGDVLRTWKTEKSLLDESGTAGAADANVSLFGNLPYNIAGILLGAFAENGMFFKRAVVTVQKEVAERICAKENSACYSSLSVLISSIYTASRVALIKPANFYPPPNVDSVCIRLDIKPETAVLPSGFFRMVRALFSRRRKTLKNNLEALYGAQAAAALNAAGISPNLRAENLSVEDFLRLFAVISK